MGTTVSVAVLFTDLVESTALASRVGPERAEELRVEHFGVLRGIVGAHGGREVKNLGDGLMVVFASPSSALAAGVAMQQAFEARNRVAEEALDIRVAISAGEADEDGGDFFGPPVIEAARLCGVCDAGQVLTSALVRLFVGARGGFVFESLGAQVLKGIDEPVEILAVAWEPLTEAEVAAFEVPLPARLTPAEGAVFVGRDDERARWDDAWKRVRAGERRVWLLGGEAGIGKTTFVSHVTASTHGDGAVVLYGRCDEELGVPYQPWVEALGSLAASAPDEVIHEHVEASGGALARLAPRLTQRSAIEAPSASDGEADRFALFGAVADLLSRAATRLPVVVVLDDLHWADKPTVQLLRHLAGGAEPSRLMIVGTYRPTDIDARHPLTEAFAALHREPGVEFVDLAGLDDVALLELMERTAGHELPDEGIALRDAIAAETSGNPFFVTEILFHLAETGAIRRESGRWIATPDLAEHGLPVSVRQVVGERVARLGDEAERLLRTAAVIGRDFDLPLLAEVAGVDEDDALDVLDAAVAASLVHNVGPDRYSFAHALVEHTLYDDLTPSRRARVHGRIADALEQQCGADPGQRIGELAHHWAAAMVPGDAAKVVDYARRAGDRAIEQLAPDEAVRWYRQALDALGDADDEQRCEISVRLGDAERQAGDPGHRERLLEAAALAQRLGRDDLLVEAARLNSRGFAPLTTDHERVAVLESALTVTGEGTRERARLLAVLSGELRNEPRRLVIAREALEVARRTHDRDVILEALTSAWHATMMPEELDEHRGYAEESMLLSDASVDPLRRFHAVGAMQRALLEAGDVADVEALGVEYARLADRLGQPMLRWMVRFRSAVVATFFGRYSEGEQAAEEALALGVDAGQPDAPLVYGAQILMLRHTQGRHGEVVPLVRDAAEENPTALALQAALPFFLAHTGARDDAKDAFHRLLATLAPTEDDMWLPALAMAAETAAILDDGAHAASVHGWLAPHADRACMYPQAHFGAASYYLGRLEVALGEVDLAERHLEHALDFNTRMQAPFFRAQSMVELASVIGARDPERTHGLVGDALALADAFGLAGVRARALAVASA